MTYCVGIRTHEGLVLASDSRTNSGIDQVCVCRKMHNFAVPGERMFTILSSGSLSVTQSVMTRLQHEFQTGGGLAAAATMYEAARCVGGHVREVAALHREYLERDNVAFSVNLIIGGQIRGEPPQLYMIYAQGNPIRATQASPFLQIGETKYGRPILDRGVRYGATTLDQAVKYALISLDSTMRSNVAVGPPIDLLVYGTDEFAVRRYRRLNADDPDLVDIRGSWERELRRAIGQLPTLGFPQPARADEFFTAVTVDD